MEPCVICIWYWADLKVAATKLSIVDADVVVVVSVDAWIDIIGVIVPAPTSNPLLAVATPIESKNVTSSYVIVPPIVTFPVNVAAVPVIFPAIFINDYGAYIEMNDPKIFGALVAIIVGYFSRNVIATIFSGLLSYWIIIFVFLS